MNKRDVIALMEGMPDEVDPEELIYRIYLAKKLEHAEEDRRAGRVTSHEEFERERWMSGSRSLDLRGRSGHAGDPSLHHDATANTVTIMEVVHGRRLWAPPNGIN